MLRISKLTDYATVVLAFLATHGDRPYAAGDIAQSTRLAAPTVAKLLKKLTRGGLVTSSRGSQGGYQLAKPATQISAATILDALEGKFALTECSGEHSACSIASSCHVGHSWQRVNAAIHRALTDVTLAQLAGLERTAPSLNLHPRGTTQPLVRLNRTR